MKSENQSDSGLTFRMAGMLDGRKWAYSLSLFGCGMMDSSVSILTALLMSFVLDAIVAQDSNAILMICMLFSAVIVVAGVLTWVFHYWFGKTVKTAMNDIRLRVFHHMEQLPVSYYENTHSGDSLSRVTNDLGAMEKAIASDTRSVISLVITGIGSAVAMFLLDWRFAIAMLVLGLLSTYVNARFAKPLRKLGTDIQRNAGQQMERLSNIIAGTQVSRMFQMTNIIQRKYQDTTDRLAVLSIARARKSAWLNGTNFFLLWINNGGAFVIGSIMLVQNEMTVGSLIGVVLLLENVTNLFRNLGVFWANLQSSLAGAERVFELLDEQREDDRAQVSTSRLEAAATVDIQEEADNEDSVLAFDRIGFAYREGENVLSGLSFKVKKGQLVALVGPSGGGKSTILKLLLGFYPFQSGDIHILGRRFADYTLHELRELIAYVPQEPYLFEGTIEQNIRYGRAGATREEVEAAARAAYAHHFIIEQENGYETKVGERGVRLSGGQKQRIAIARAILKNAPILLLDEATSALDTESERAVQQGLERLMEGRTTIAIAHRLSTITQADKILVIKNGQLAESGKHSELIESGGVYSRLHHLQETV